MTPEELSEIRSRWENGLTDQSIGEAQETIMKMDDYIRELQEKADKWDKVAHLLPPPPVGGYADDDKIPPFIEVRKNDL